MLGQARGIVLEDILIISGLVGTQCVTGAYNVFLDHLLALGISSLFIVVVFCLGSAAVLLPCAIAFERKKWPAKLTLTMVAQFLSIGLGGSIYQVMMLLGMKMTSPAVASAMPNLVPGLVFIVAVFLRLEKFNLKCKFSGAKILGTLVCLAGAMVISFLKNNPADPSKLNLLLPEDLGNSSYNDNDWILGCLLLFVGVVSVSCAVVMQAITLASFPAPMTLIVTTTVAISFFVATLQVAMEGKLDSGLPNISASVVAEIFIVGGVMVGIPLAFQAWCVHKLGPVLVAMFNPVATISSCVLSALLLGQVISMGSISGIVLLFCGLYIFLWGKKSETAARETNDVSRPRPCDVEKPLLS